MRITPILAAITIIVPTFAFLVSADAPALHVDAGSSVRAGVNAQFSLNGFVEGGSAPTTTWTAPPGCSIDVQALDALASCSDAGQKVFVFTATEGVTSASDTVAVAIGETTSTVLAEATGYTYAGAAGVNVLPEDPILFTVPEGASRLVAVLTWEFPGDDFDFTLTHGDESYVANSADTASETLVLDLPEAGAWSAEIQPFLAYLNEWTFTVSAEQTTGGGELPTLATAGWAGPIGATASLGAMAAGGTGALSFAWETDPASRRFDDGTGSLLETIYDGAPFAFVRVTDEAGYEVTAKASLAEAGSAARPLTVVAVIDSGFSVYHNDFLGSRHPWNVDGDASNGIDFTAHPASFITNYPTAEPLLLTLPTEDLASSDQLRAADADIWESMNESTAEAPRLYWIPGTKVIGAMQWGGTEFPAGNSAHGSASASVAAGNVHGSCPECLFVLIAGGTPDALAWAASQPWIDVVTNSYGHGSVLQTATLGFTRDNIYLLSSIEATKAGSEEGQVIVFSSGNGFVNAFDVPMFTYWSSEKGPDWMVTVGAVASEDEQTYTGAGKPVDMSSIGESYPSSGGSTANGEGTHSGTSNAAPTSAGYFAKVLQRSREILGDTSVGHADGIVASGAPVPCGVAWADCPLGDGILTRRELADLVYHNILPSPQVIPPYPQTIPTEEHAYYYQGHGVVSGRMYGVAHYDAEWTRMVDAAVGDAAPYARPLGESDWFVTDSKCRQALWGAWSGGYYTGQTHAPDPETDTVAFAYDAWCSQLSAGTLATLAPTLGPVVNPLG